MKRLIFLTVALVYCGVISAFDWKPKPNKELFADMIAYAELFKADAAGTAAEPLLADFLSKAEKKFRSDEYAWVYDVYALCAKLETLFPPRIDDGSVEAEIRRHILRLIDFPVHLDNLGTNAGERAKSVFAISRDRYRENAALAAVKWLKSVNPSVGELAIFKVYNMGFILKTSERTIAVDPCFLVSESAVKSLVKEIDAFFITHPHGDHYSDNVINEIARQGKVLVSSYDVAPYYRVPHKYIIWENVFEPFNIGGIDVRILAGHQNRSCAAAMPNNVYNLTFDGWTFVTNGDNSDMELQSGVSEMPVPDIMTAASWNKPQVLQDNVRLCEGWVEGRTVFIPSHENEFGHRVQQRESYWEAFTREDRYNNPEFDYFPMLLMDIGEGWILKRQ